MAGEFVYLGALLVEAHPSAAVLNVIVFHLHLNGGAQRGQAYTP